MNVKITLSDECRKARFLAGIETPVTVVLEAPLDALAPVVREVLWALPAATDGDKDMQFPAIIFPWNARQIFYAEILPESPAQWCEILLSYQRELTKVRQAIKDAETADKMQKIDNFRRYLANWKPMPLQRSEYNKPVAPVNISTLPADILASWERVNREYQEFLTEQARIREEDAAYAEAKKAKAEADKSAWIAVHGSDYLRKAHAAGYDCGRRYVTERAAMEFPGFVVDYDDRAEWKRRSAPSEAALDAALAIEGSEVVWLTQGPDGEISGWFVQCEAIVVQGFLGKYDLVKIIS